MIPKPPPREGLLGFLLLPPFRVQGISVAGESTCVQVPELDVCFDMGECPRAALASRFVAISHGHMDHVGALAYYCSQRRFQGMGNGHILCDARIAGSVQRMMTGFVDLEKQRTLYDLTPMEPEKLVPIKPGIFIRGFYTEHTAPSMGYVLLEKRSKLKPEFAEFPQEKLRELKDRGVEITRTLEIPLVAYLGDTAPGPHLIRDDVRKAEIIITECTFFEPEHKERAKIGMHLHVTDVAEWIRVSECKAMVLTHISRRTHLGYAREQLLEHLGPERSAKVHLLMDHRTNRERYEKQEAESVAREAALNARPGTGQAPTPPAEQGGEDGAE